MTDRLARIIVELYAAPPAAFTPRRKARAAELAGTGRVDEARALRRLRRPSPPLWAVNQLAHAETARLTAFVGLVDEVRRSQLRDPRAISGPLLRQRAELAALVGRAGELLAVHGQRATAATRRRIADTLLGAAVDRDRARALREGRLTEELPAPGFEVLAGAPAAPRLRVLPGGRRSEPRRPPSAPPAPPPAPPATASPPRRSRPRRSSDRS